MSKLPLDLAKFRKVKSDKDTSTFQHYEGHQLTVAHNKLSSKLRSQLDKIPMAKPKGQKESVQRFYGGGTAQDEGDQVAQDAINAPVRPEYAQALAQEQAKSNPQLDAVYGDAATRANKDLADADANKNNSAAYQQQQGSIMDMMNANRAKQGLPPIQGSGPAPFSITPGPLTASLDRTQDSMPSSGDAPQAAATTDPNDPYGRLAAMNQQLQGIKDVGAGQQAEQAALGQQGLQNIPQEKNYADTLQNAAQARTDTLQGLATEDQKFLQDHNNGLIDTHRYIDNMSTGGKISTGIGLILGGMGAGLTHGPNLAFQYLQDQVNKDIDAQKNDLNSHYNYNLQKTKNANDAYDLTKFQAMEVLRSHLRTVADQTADPLAKARALQFSGMAENSLGQLSQQMANTKMQQALFSGKGGANTGMLLESVPPEMRDRAVQLPGGGMRLAVTKEGAKEVRDQVQTMQPIFSQLDRLESLGPSATIPGTPAYQQAKSIQATLIPLTNENAGLKRLSSEDIENIKHMFKDPTTFSGQIAGGAKTKQFKQFLQDKLMSTMGSQLEGGSPMVNNQDGPPKQTKMSGGVLWTRGPKGEAIRVR